MVDPSLRDAMRVVVLGLTSLLCSVLSTAQGHDEVATARHRADLVDELQRRAFDYFVEQVNPRNGLVRDRSTQSSPASIAGTGFALPIWAVGVERGWIERDRALSLTRALLRLLRDCEQGEGADASGYRGLYYHFLDMEDGRRVWNCELSTIDTALLLAGVRFARQYFDRAEEVDVRGLADELTERVQWDWLTMRAGDGYDDSLSHGWRPETGTIPIGWTGYSEALILYVLAAGSGWEGAEAGYRAWSEAYDWVEPYPGFAHVPFGPLFGHQYSHVFVDFRGMRDEAMRGRGLDYFENSCRAVEVQRRYAQANPGGFEGYGEHVWGLTACDGPGAAASTESRTFFGYSARGTVGVDRVLNDDGTIAPTAAAASIAFAPDVAMAAIAAMHDRYGAAGLWGPYGFQDAFNPTAGWFADDVLAIDQGPIVLMIENWRNGFVWRHAMRDPVLRRGLRVLGFDEPPEPRFEAAIRAFEAADLKEPPPADPILFVGSSSIVGWRDLAADMAPRSVLNRGFGGSEASEVIHFFDRVVRPYDPRAIVLYEGDNDIAAGCSPAEVLVRHREIHRLVGQHLPGTTLFVLAIKPSIARRELWPIMQVANGLLAEFCAETPGANFVDISPGMLEADGGIRREIFRDDMLHMNRMGYLGWAEAVNAALAANGL